MITAEDFKRRVGKKPHNDDLERCNCDRQGEIGHWQCGWNKQKDLPVFMVGKEGAEWS